MTTETESLIFDQTQLYFLASLLQVPYLLGLEDPLLGLLADEIEERLEKTLEVLAERGILQVRADGSFTVDAGVATLVEAGASAKRTLIAARTGPNGDSHLRFVHLTPDLLVEQEALPHGEIALTPVHDQEMLQQRLANFWALPEALAAPGPALTLTEADLTEARRLALEEGAEACSAFLNRLGLPAEAVEGLASALTDGRSAGSLVTLHREGREMLYGESLAWLVGSQGAWRLQPLSQEPPAVRLIPATTAEIYQRLAAMVSALRP